MEMTESSNSEFQKANFVCLSSLFTFVLCPSVNNVVLQPLKIYLAFCFDTFKSTNVNYIELSHLAASFCFNTCNIRSIPENFRSLNQMK